MTTILYPYQIIGVKKLEKFDGRALLADEMGLGKTIQVLTYFRQNKSEIKPAVVVCPASLKYNWKKEASLHVNLRSEVLESRKVNIKVGLDKPPIYIINYDILDGWLEFLLNLDPGLVILDECHYIKNRAAKRSKLVKKLCKYVPKVIALSGTPLTSKPAELWNVLNLIQPKLYPSFTPYAMKHCKPTRTPWGWQFKGAEKLDELHKDLKKQMMIRRTKAQVLHHLPAKTRSIVPVSLSSRKEYQAAERDFVSWLFKHKGPGAAKTIRAQKLAKFNYLKMLAGKLKQPAVFNWIDDFFENSDGKLIVFAWHNMVIQNLYERYKHKSVFVTGSVTGKHRQVAFDKFQTHPKCRLFLGNIQAAGTGWNGTAASTVAFAELGWNPGDHVQAEDRIHRIGQFDAAQIYYLVAQETIEEKLIKVIQEKQSVLDSTLDGGVREDLDNIYNQLEEEILRNAARKAGQFSVR